MTTPVTLIILDGFAEGKEEEGNPLLKANIPNLRIYLDNFPKTQLGASEEAVGLEKGQIGSSEVGHLTLGAGRVILQTSKRISQSIENGSFHKNEAYLSVIEMVKKNGSSLHIMGLMSDAGVHANISHMYELLKMAKLSGIEKVWLHLFTDGRDAPPTSGKHYLTLVEKELRSLHLGTIATISGRYYAMDRDNRWERTKQAYDALVHAKAPGAKDAREVIDQSYANSVGDEFIEPTVIDGYTGMREGDGMICFNFRSDRVRQITRSLVEKKFSDFDIGSRPSILYAGTSLYYPELESPIAFPPIALTNILPEVLSKNGFSQLHAAETEKYAHVTYFFNGGVETQFPKEDRILLPSPKVATYDLKPEMSAAELTDSVVHRINTGEYDFILVNFANTDMVGHTGKMDAVIKALETVDACVKQVVDATLEQDGAVLLTADHGNCEHLVDGGESHTSHTLSKVPCVLISPEDSPFRNVTLTDGSLANVAPTILEIMEIDRPQEMGSSLLK